MKFGIVLFPGSNCDRDMLHVLNHVMHVKAEIIWHKEASLKNYDLNDCIVLPGGFSYGDYLRTGAIARFSPIMDAVIDFANRGGMVLGICNGFQILCESGLLPGALLQNTNQKYICKNVNLKVVTNNSALTRNISDSVLSIPIAHGEGRYHADSETLATLNENDQVLFRYCDTEANITEASNPNGSLENIAGITNKNRNVFGMMPHPERASENILGNNNGFQLFDSLIHPIFAN